MLARSLSILLALPLSLTGVLGATRLVAGVQEVRSPFLDLTYDEALAQACEDDRSVLLFFTEDSSVPCELMERSTWGDARVAGWIERECVAIRVDVDRDVERAMRLAVRHAPTLVFLDGQGRERGRLNGYVDAQAFLTRATGFGRGADVRERVAPSFGGDPSDPMQREHHGDALLRAGFLEEALAEYLWCWDEGLEHSPSFVGVRGSFLLGDLRDLAVGLPVETDAAMEARRAEARARLFDPAADARALHHAAMDLHALDRSYFEDLSRSIEDYEAVLAAGDSLARAGRALAGLLLEELIELGRYDLVLQANPDAVAQFQRMVERLERRRARRDLRRVEIDSLIRLGARWVEACSGAGRPDDARSIANGVLSITTGTSAWIELLGGCERAGAEELARSLHARARRELAAEELEAVDAAASWLD